MLNALAAHSFSVAEAAKAVGMQGINFYRLIRKYNIKLPRAEEEQFYGNGSD